MPANVIGGLITYLQDTFDIYISDGEVPRTDPDGNVINPANGVWPAYEMDMPDSGFNREDTFEDPFTDEGTVILTIWGTTRAQVHAALGLVEAQLRNANNWPDINVNNAGLPAQYQVYELRLENWVEKQERDVRTQGSRLLYRGSLTFTVGVNGTIPSRNP